MHQELSEKLCYMPRAWISHNDIKWIKQYLLLFKKNNLETFTQ